jgi:S1-C subfamily serine protease
MNHIRVFFGLGVLIILVSGTLARTQSEMPGLLSLESLKTMHFTKADAGDQAAAPSYSDVSDVIAACRAYSRGLALLPNYHDPILTRGQTGIAVFRKVSPSVVLVVTGDIKNDQFSETGLGTGVIIDQSGIVLTNWHVIAGSQAGAIFLKPENGTDPAQNSAYWARLIAQDPQADLALIRFIKPPAGLTPVKFGEIALIQVAEDIHIIGHPHGHLWSYSTGVVSQIRDNYDWKYSDGSAHLAKVLQMQTAINPGNSGGPVLDDAGNLLGLVAMGEEGQNLNYAIAIDVIKGFVSRSMAAKSRGIEAQNKSPKGDFYTGQTKDGASIAKAVYPDLVSYTIHDSKGAVVELIAETSDGATLTGTNPNAFGGFARWSFRLAGGKTVVVNSAGMAPELISANKGK